MGRLVFVTITVENRTDSAPAHCDVVIGKISAHIKKMDYDIPSLEVEGAVEEIFERHCVPHKSPKYDRKLVTLLRGLSRYRAAQCSALREAVRETRA